MMYIQALKDMHTAMTRILDETKAHWEKKCAVNMLLYFQDCNDETLCFLSRNFLQNPNNLKVRKRIIQRVADEIEDLL